MPGVVRTRAGYTGGTKTNPTYYNLGDHTETLQIDFDPKTVSYEKLLEIFWSSHSPEQKSFSRQYRCALFVHDDEQKRLAVATKKHVAEKLGVEVQTAIEPAGKFYLAEGYHQKYELRRERELLAEFRAMYPGEQDFINSTAAARVNSYVSGYGTIEQLEAEIDDLGLSPASQRRLVEIVRRSQR